MSDRVQALRRLSPQARILVFAERADYALEMELARLRVSGFVLWENVNALSLHWTLGLVLEAGLRVVSPLAVDEIAFHERRVHARAEELKFSDRERAIMRGLAHGLSERRVAEEEGVGLRTVQRSVEKLLERLEARNLYDLRLKARELGFGPE